MRREDEMGTPFSRFFPERRGDCLYTGYSFPNLGGGGGGKPGSKGVARAQSLDLGIPF